MLKQKTKWYAAGLHFECVQCGNCCSGPPGYVWVTREEVKAIAEFLGCNEGTLDKSQLRRVGVRYSLTERPSGDCCFLNRAGDKTTCLIYPVRPAQCRAWPFWNENLRSPDTWNRAAANCPGMNVGKHYDLAAIEELRGCK